MSVPAVVAGLEDLVKVSIRDLKRQSNTQGRLIFCVCKGKENVSNHRRYEWTKIPCQLICSKLETRPNQDYDKDVMMEQTKYSNFFLHTEISTFL